MLVRDIKCLFLISSLIVLFFTTNILFLPISSSTAQSKPSIADELLEKHLRQLQKIEKGREVFAQYLKNRGEQIPLYGSSEYTKQLFELAEPGGKFHHHDPKKWELIDAYAYDYYRENFLPRVSPNDVGKHQALGLPQDTPNIKGSLQQKTSLQSTLYNRTGARIYALLYAGYPDDNPVNKNYNPSYHFFPDGDCANFASQVLHKGGGIPQIDAWWRPWWDKDDWYYYIRGNDAFNFNNDDTWSWSWVKSETLHWHIRSRLGNLITTTSQLQIGDIIQIDFQKDGWIDHSMVVTSIDSSGIKISQHTINRTDYPLSNILNAYPTAWFYYLNITY